ncbi:MAG TPA: hypothetical protein VF665_18380 [Longimicrobium sp.]|jgi:hypothetical protein|uniref:hypothetical protein n=1 Tax=Longimicrobium sp. TaxID=2029185 RepID=UPI002ED9A8CF
MSIKDIDLSELRAMWERSRAAVAELRARTDPTGMTRPARDPDEREFLRQHGGLGPFVEKDEPGWREWRNRGNTLD